MSHARRQKERESHRQRPLLSERIQRNPVLRFLAGLMVGNARWRQNTLGEGSVAPTPQMLSPDPMSDAVDERDRSMRADQES
jgi:hypothetical protein